MSLLRFIKELQDESAAEDNQKWDDQFHDLRQTLPLLSEGTSPGSLPLDADSIRSAFSESKMFGMQVDSEGDLLNDELPEAALTPPVEKQVEPSAKTQLSATEVPLKLLNMKRQGHSSTLHLRKKPQAPTGKTCVQNTCMKVNKEKSLSELLKLVNTII